MPKERPAGEVLKEGYQNDTLVAHHQTPLYSGRIINPWFGDVYHFEHLTEDELKIHRGLFDIIKKTQTGQDTEDLFMTRKDGKLLQNLNLKQLEELYPQGVITDLRKDLTDLPKDGEVYLQRQGERTDMQGNYLPYSESKRPGEDAAARYRKSRARPRGQF